MKIRIDGYIVPNEWKEVYDYYEQPAFCPSDIINAKQAAKDEKLEITIGTCYGGSIFAGSEIGAEIKSHAGGAEIEVTGLAASAASVIAMYAKNRMAPTAMLMVHNVSSMAAGDYRVMEKESDTLKQCNKAMASAYIMKSGMSEEDALKMMDDETWLTAAQAKEKGLIDEIMFENLDAQQMVASFGPGMIPKAVIDKTLAILAEQKAEPQKDNFDFAYKKLNLIEKTII